MVAEQQAVEHLRVFRSVLEDDHGERPQVAQRGIGWSGRMSHKARVAVAEPVGGLAATAKSSRRVTFTLFGSHAAGFPNYLSGTAFRLRQICCRLEDEVDDVAAK